MTHFLLDLARRAIESELVEVKLVVGEIPEEFKTKKACFVTLTIKGKLRGCIGHLVAIQPVYLDVIENARNAAFRDPRFLPLTKKELEEVEIEISILGVPKSYKYENTGQLLEYLQKEKPGVIVEKDGYSATFLPQVWQELKRPEEFLSQLCLKAGMAGGEWRRGVGIRVYKVEVIK